MSHAVHVPHDTVVEHARRDDIVRLVPSGYDALLDAGARDGFITDLLRPRFKKITALDLTTPKIEGVECVAGDLTNLQFPDGAFDYVMCSEVLEHIPDVSRACAEIIRVARHGAIIGVPYRQDTRIHRTTCGSCWHVSPPWGHVNAFDEAKLARLFAPLRLVERSFVGSDNSHTNFLAVWLMDYGKNPWGIYGINEFCLSCGRAIAEAPKRNFGERLSSAAAQILQSAHTKLSAPHPAWIHARFER